MAYKNETYKQFRESIVRQVNNKKINEIASNMTGNFGGSPISNRNVSPDLSDDFQKDNPHQEIKEIKKLIEAKEKELHELQRRKVELMRKITGRL